MSQDPQFGSKQGTMTSSLGRTSFGNHQRTLTVEDTTADVSDDFPEEFQQAYKAEKAAEQTNGFIKSQRPKQDADILGYKDIEKLRKKDDIPEYARSSLEILTGIGRANLEETIDGHVFSLRSLKSREQKELFTNGSKIKDTLEQSYYIKYATLAWSLYKIDGKDLEDVIQSNQFEDKMALMAEFAEEVIDHLYNKYSQITKSNMDRLGLIGKNDKEISDNVKK